MLIHLLPEEFARIRIVSVIERAEITGAYPVAYAVVNRKFVHPAFFIKFFIMLCRDIELGPYGYHDTSVHVMDRINHAFGIGETLFVKFMASPRILLPVQPVYNDIVNRDIALAEFGECRLHFLLSVILLAPLPVTHSPLRHYGRLAGKSAIALYDVVHRLTVYEVVVNLLLHLAPPAHFKLLFGVGRTVYAKATVCHGTIGFPLYLYRHTHTGLQFGGELEAIGIPCRTPTFGHNQFVVNIYFLIAGIVHDKTIQSGNLRLDIAFICHMRTVKREIGGQVDHMGEIATLQMLEINRVLTLYERFATVGRYICAGQRTLLAVLVIQLEYSAELLVILRIAPATKRVAVPKNTVVIGRHDKWHRYFGIVLKELFVFTFIIEFIGLMLSEAVYALLIVDRLEELLHCIGFLALNLDRSKAASSLILGKNKLAVLIIKQHLTVGKRHGGRNARRAYRYGRVGVGNIEMRNGILRYYNKTRSIGKLPVGSGRHAYEFFAEHLKPYKTCAVGIHVFDIDRDSGISLIVGRR